MAGTFLAVDRDLQGNTIESRQHKQERQAYRGRQREPDRQTRRSQHLSQAVNTDQNRIPHHHLQKDESPLCSDPTNSKCMEERNATTGETSSCDTEEVICLDGTPKKIPDMATHSIQGPATNSSNSVRNINMDTSRNQAPRSPQQGARTNLDSNLSPQQGAMTNLDSNLSSEDQPPKSNPNNPTKPFLCMGRASHQTCIEKRDF